MCIHYLSYLFSTPQRFCQPGIAGAKHLQYMGAEQVLFIRQKPDQLVEGERQGTAMRKTLLNRIRRILRNRRLRRMMTRVISIVAALVVFVTTYALVLPAITMEREADCGIEAHQHDDFCYERQLVCDIPEDPGHRHDDACYRAESVLKCVTAEHTHGEACYDEEGNLLCEQAEHTHDASCYEEERELICGLEESAGHQHDDSCYENVLVCGKEVHVHSEDCYHQDPVEEEEAYSAEDEVPEEDRYLEEYAVPEEEQNQYVDEPADEPDEDPAQTPADAETYGPGGSSGAGGDAGAAQQDGEGASGRTGNEPVQEGGAEVYIPEAEAEPEVPLAAPLVPELEPLDFRTLLNSHTGIYYYHVQPGEVVENSAQITGWKKVTADTELGEKDLLRVYLAYTLPAGAVNTTNAVVRYRLPGNLHLTDDQVKAINGTENGIAAQYVDYGTLTLTDPDNYHKYLGAEAVEGTRTPDQDEEAYLAAGGADGNGQEYISAVVRVENIGDANSGGRTGQDLLFTFVPYTVFKNRHEYDGSGQQTRTGVKVRGWFSLDFNMGQVDFDEVNVDGDREIRTADVVFAEEDEGLQIEEIRTGLRFVCAAEPGAEEDPEAADPVRMPEDGLEDPAEQAAEAEGTGSADPAEDGNAPGGEAAEENAAADGDKDPENAENEDKLIKLFDESEEDGKKDSDKADTDKADSDKKDPDENSEKDALAEIMPAMSFEDTIRVSTGRPAGAETKGSGGTVADAADALPKKANVTVRVEADEGTFPAGTTMVLAAVKDLDAVAETVQETVENGSSESGAGHTDSHGAGADAASGQAGKAAGSGKDGTGAPSGNTGLRTYGFQAVDISFRDADGNEIEPAKPVRVAMTSEIVEQVRREQTEDPTTAVADPVVVHIDDNGNVETMDLIAPEEIEPAQGRTEEELREEAEAEAAARKEEKEKEAEAAGEAEKKTAGEEKAENKEAEDKEAADKEAVDKEERKEGTAPDNSGNTEAPAASGGDDTEAGEAETADRPETVEDKEEQGTDRKADPAEGQDEPSADTETANPGTSRNIPSNVPSALQTVAFNTDAFSVYVIVYTVDFHWEVDGRQYEYSLPGGGFASFSKLMEILGVTEKDAQEESQNVSEGSPADEAAQEASQNDPENNLDDADNEDSRVRSALTMEDVQVSEETRRFVADVETVEFSSPELVWVAKVGEETTVGGLKEANELEVQYSAELTEEEIETINAQTVEAGDWALISMLPFASEETLTVTMKDGEQFVVKVTDAQYDGSKVTDFNGATGALINKANNNAVLGIAQSSTALQAVAVTVNGDQISTADGSPDLTQWTFTYRSTSGGYDRYRIQCAAGYLNLGNGSASISSTPKDLIVVTRQNNGETQIRIASSDYDALNNTSNVTANGYSAYRNWNYNTNPGEWFTVYELTYPDDPFGLDGQARTIINNRDGGNNWQALRDEIDGTKDGRGYYVSGNATTYTRTDNVDYSSGTDVVWTFEFVKNDSTGAYYRIKTANGYLFIDPDVTKKSDMPSNQSHAFEHALRLESAAGDGSSSDGTLIRIVPNGDGTYLLQNRNGVSLWNYGNNQFWLSTLTQDGESDQGKLNSRFRLATRLEPPHVTVHYVDRYGNPLTGVTYTGTNPLVTQNPDGTFTIPYSWSGQTTETSVDLRTQFSKEGYTYANSHLAGNDADNREMKQDGLVIDSVLTSTSNGTNLSFKSDSGETNWNMSGNPPMGNLAYGNLTSHNLSGRFNRRPAVDGDVVPYALSNNKDIYVVLDPVPTETTGSGPGSVNPGEVPPPSLEKTMEDNGDGTYTLSLKVDAHAKNASDTNKANVLFVVDTSSSMRNITTNGSTRIIDTHDAVLEFGQKLLSYNNETRPDAVEVSMLTFDGGVTERLDWTRSKTEFQDTVNTYLKYYYLHTGTDWEDSMDEAYKKLLNDTDDDPTFVVFFTDGEPSQYTGFHGAGENTNTNVPDPITGGTEHEPVSGGYPNFYSYFLCREASKDEMRAIVNTGAQLYGIYAYNTTNESYNGYNGREDGAKMLHNAIKYGYNTTADLTNNLFYEAKNTSDLQGAFDKIYNLITEKVGFTNVAVTDGITAGVTSSTVLNGDVSAFTYIIRDKSKAVAYKVTVAPHGAPEGTDEGKPIFWIGGHGPPVVGEIKEISTTKIVTDDDGRPILDENNKIQTETIDVEVYYYKDADDNEYIMPIAVPDETVTWDLSPFGVLKDGYSYEVNFVVWPNQDAYDLVADLNNGKRPDIEATANWAAQPLKTDSSGRQYRQGGFADYPYISRYEDNGVYAAMSNTEQNVEYYKVDNKIVNGEEVTEITGPFEKPVDPPDPMPLTASYSHIEKQWNVERDRGIFAQYLYNTDGTSKEFKVDFDIFQGTELVTPYKTVSLGWDSEANNGQGAYIWAEGDTLTNVTYAGYPHQIGTRWANNLSIATGLMLTEGRMEELGLNKSLYPSAEYNNVTYYILEPGHDYTIKEHQSGTIGYEFDFESPVYHPMLVDNVLQNVEITYTKDNTGKITAASITGLSDSEEGLSGLRVENTLRGYINVDKIVVDEDDRQVESDNTKFEYTVKLESSTDPGPFEGDHIPWYGINGLFYNDGNNNYYQVYETTDHTWKLKNENGEEFVVTSTGFDTDKVEAQTVIYRIK